MLAQARVFPTSGKYRSLLGDFSSRTTELVLKIPNRPRCCTPLDSLPRPSAIAEHKQEREANDTECQTKNLNKRMGYAVLHLEKAKGADSGMSAHIERTIQSKNTDPTRTHLNRELIQFPDGVRNRTVAIQHHLNTAIRR